MTHDEKENVSNTLYVRALGIVGICRCRADEVEIAYPVADHHVARTYESIERFLREDGRIIVPQNIDILPFIRGINLLGLEAEAAYLYNDCLVNNVFTPFGSYSHTGVKHYLIAASFEDVNIKKTFEELKSKSYYKCDSHWSDDSRFHKQV